VIIGFVVDASEPT